MLSKVLSLHKLSYPQTWNIEQEKDREKQKVGGRPANLNERKGDRDLEQRGKKQRSRHFFGGRTTWKLCSGGDKMRNASGHQCNVKNNNNLLLITKLIIKPIYKSFHFISSCSFQLKENSFHYY